MIRMFKPEDGRVVIMRTDLNYVEVSTGKHFCLLYRMFPSGSYGDYVRVFYSSSKTELTYDGYIITVDKNHKEIVRRNYH